MIALASLPRADVARVAHLSLPPEQRDFVGSIEEMSADPDPLQEFHVALAAEGPVAFFKIDRDYTRRITRLPPKAHGLRGLLVGGQFQGKGYGRALLVALPAYVAWRYPALKELWLSVDVENKVAIKAYSAAGWAIHGPPFEGRVGPEHVMLCEIRANRP